MPSKFFTQKIADELGVEIVNKYAQTLTVSQADYLRGVVTHKRERVLYVALTEAGYLAVICRMARPIDGYNYTEDIRTRHGKSWHCKLYRSYNSEFKFCF
jgi:hypothetical protein